MLQKEKEHRVYGPRFIEMFYISSSIDKWGDAVTQKVVCCSLFTRNSVTRNVTPQRRFVTTWILFLGLLIL